jgi:pimeloyl-ACP methyl ester carboxylesterase
VPIIPLKQVKATFPVLKNPANRKRAVKFTEDEWRYAFGNALSEEESREAYERYAIPASGPIFFESALANLTPGHQHTWVDYRNESRPPLLFISGSEDNLMPPKIQASNARHYKGEGTVTEVREFEGRGHAIVAEPNWEEVADFALEWALTQTGGDTR